MTDLVRCPQCGIEDTASAFSVWFCPSVPDRCDGCECDDTRRHCEACDHDWTIPVAASEARS